MATSTTRGSATVRASAAADDIPLGLPPTLM
jgi:hypothetical protein